MATPTPTKIIVGRPMVEAHVNDGQYLAHAITLDTVVSVRTKLLNKYDEGESRIIRHEWSLTFEFILSEDSDIFEQSGIDSPGNLNEIVEQTLQIIQSQGIAITFFEHTGPFAHLVPRVHLNNNVAVYGWQVASLHGFKPQSVNIEPIVGSKAVMITWEVKVETVPNNEAINQYGITNLSSELRLSIDKDGDLQIIVAGTLYAQTSRDLHRGRELINLVYSPVRAGVFVVTDLEDLVEGNFSVFQGFTKEIDYNIEKSGRSAKFSITYSQVKSDSAFPYLLRNIQFDQEVASTLMPSKDGKGGFQQWNMSFRGKITLPPRLNAIYAWYVMHLLVQQRLRRAKLKFKLPQSAKINDNGEAGKEKPTDKDTLAIPVAIRMKHSVYERKLEFNLTYMVLTDLSKLATGTCFFDRLNNDYQRKIDNPNKVYTPRKLSTQWLDWTQTTDRGEAANSQYQKHSDAWGTEILENMQTFDLSKGPGVQGPQRHVLVTTIRDPNEEDPSYKKNPYDMSVPMGYSPGVEINLNDYKGSPSFPGQASVTETSTLEATQTTASYYEQIEPRNSWMAFNQDYEVLETNPTIPVEALAEVTSADFTNAELSYQMGAIAPPEMLKQFAEQTSAFYQGRATPSVSDTLSFRKTYANRHGRFYIRVTGFAIRAKYKIPIPALTKIAGSDAIRVGNGRTLFKQMNASGEIPVYLAAWDQTYTVDKSILSSDILANLQTSGASIYYI